MNRHGIALSIVLLTAVVLIILLPPSEVGAQEDADPYIFAESDLPDFRPSSTGDVAGLGKLIFIPGSSEDSGGDLDATLVALREPSGRERWRATFGRPARTDRFFHVATTDATVCVSGVGTMTGNTILVGCYRAWDGTLLWFREIRSPVLFFPQTDLRIIRDAVWVSIANGSFLLRFELADGRP